MTLTDLIKKMSEDKEFEAKYRELDSIDAVMEQAAADGYSITAEDVEALRREAEYSETGRTELSDEMMEDVAGGFLLGPILPQSWLRQWVLSLFGENQGSSAVSEADNRENRQNSPSITTLPFSQANPVTITTLPHDPSGQPVKVVKL